MSYQEELKWRIAEAIVKAINKEEEE